MATEQLTQQHQDLLGLAGWKYVTIPASSDADDLTDAEKVLGYMDPIDAWKDPQGVHHRTFLVHLWVENSDVLRGMIHQVSQHLKYECALTEYLESTSASPAWALSGPELLARWHLYHTKHHAKKFTTNQEGAAP